MQYIIIVIITHFFGTYYECPKLHTPLNGAKACDLWLDAGKVCTLYCNAGYDFAHKPPEFYLCGSSGEMWLPSDKVPDCSETRKPKTLLDVQLHYLADQCSEEMHAQIASNFIALYTMHLGTIARCDSTEECTIENVHVECGDQTGTLRRRDAESSKETSKVPLTVSFALKVPLPSNTSVADLNQTTEQMSSDILAAFNKTDLNLNISGIVIEFDDSKQPEIRLVRLLCDDGQVLRRTNCVNCPVGYFFNTTDCQACAVDQYQDQEAQTSCVSCPSGTSTFGAVASKWRENCEEIPSMSTTKEQGISGPVLYAIIAVAVVVPLLILIVVAIICVRKRRVRGRQREDRTVTVTGIDNPTYVDGGSIPGREHDYMEIAEIQNQFDDSNNSRLTNH